MKIKVDKEQIKGVVIAIILMSICLAILIPSAIAFYNHRVVESKQFECVATITNHEYEPPYTTSHRHTDQNGKTYYTYTHHPARYYVVYTVSFDGGTYAGNREKVSQQYYDRNADNTAVSAIFERQWRADNYETYEIRLKR